MKYVDQTKFGPDEGNCFAACVASLLGLTVDDVPDFGQGRECWLRLFEKWLKPRGLAPVIIHGKGAILPHGVHYLAGGDSPRGIPHSVIYLDGAMVHDPHPSGEGLEGEPTDYTFLVPSDVCGSLPADDALETVERNLESIIVRTDEGDPRSDWLPIISRLAKEALAALKATGRSNGTTEDERFVERLVELAIRYGSDLTELHMFIEEVRGGLDVDTAIPSPSEIWDMAERLHESEEPPSEGEKGQVNE